MINSAQSTNHKAADTPEELAQWIWGRFVGCPAEGAYRAEYEFLLERIKRMDRSTFTKGLHEGAQQIKALKGEL